MPAEVSLFNTLSRKTEPLKPLKDGQVGIYCCGPTVYNYQHIGNLRTYVFEDVLVRMLRLAGYRVNHVMNITDVGHLVSDADDGEDKMLLAAKREGKRSEELAEYYTEIFFNHCAELNIIRPDVVCKATEHIEQMIALTKRLEDRGFAYCSGGNVYFDVRKFDRYGELAKLDLESLQSGARIEVDSKKRSPLDFALWFTKSKFDNQELQWDSPWGRGYPGWHIECSAMAMNYLGESFEIHCGGIDHIPVHHTNEIAQSECATGNKFASIWMHGGFLVLNKGKMSKSTGEFLTLDALTSRGYDPISYRLLCLSGLYRNELSWGWEALDASANTLRNLKQNVFSWQSVSKKFKELPTVTDLAELVPQTQLGLDYSERFRRELFNDLNIPNALAVLHTASGDSQLDSDEKLRLILLIDQVLGLGVASWQEQPLLIPEEIQRLAEARKEARSKKLWMEADQLRAQINSLGFEVMDSAQGFQIVRRD